MGTTDGISEVAAEGFGAGAAAYEQGRPSYADDLVAWLVDRLGIAPGRAVVDLAAGTGKLTRLLAATGADLIAIEPVDAMRDQLVQACPGVDALSGTAESIPLPDSSVDALTVAQAFHWFDPPVALAEIARVLRPGGVLGIAFNERDTREPWVADLSKLIRWDERQRWRVPYTVEVDWAEVIREHGPLFRAAERYDSTYRQPMDADTMVQRVLSTSYIARLPAPEQAALAEQVRDLVAPLGERFELPVRLRRLRRLPPLIRPARR
ncbi:class I SAM-dependent methyltransferase [Aquihabitans daechungensis]|uniref:class I SAM-dependent methyltransferase n=1 Tax=Aquihabitans daechungensis TaxID=1052257 RepID=UPI003B9F9169